MFDIYPLLFEVDVLRTEMISCRMSFIATAAAYYLLSNQYVTRYIYISFNPYYNSVSRYYSILCQRKLRFREVKCSIQGQS